MVTFDNAVNNVQLSFDNNWNQIY